MAIPSFITKFKIARTNRFVAVITPPITLFDMTTDFKDIEIEAAEIPGMSIMTTEVKYDQSPTILIPYQRNPQAQATLTVRLDENHIFRKHLHKWMENIIKIPENRTSVFGYSKNYYNRHVGTVSVYQLSIEGKVTSSISLQNAFPINIDSLRYDWGDYDNFHRMNVTFSYLDSRNDFYN